MENENLFKEIQAYPELNSPLNFFPIINHDLEKYNSKYRNAEKSKIFSSVLFGFDKNSNDSSLLSGELIWKDNLKSNGKNLSKKLSKDLLNSKIRSEMINEFIQNHDQHDYLSAREAYLLSLVEVDNFDLNSYKINDAINCQNIFLKKLHQKLYDLFQKFRSKIVDDKEIKDSSFKEKSKEIEMGCNFISNCKTVLSVKPIHKYFELNLKSAFGKKLSLKEITEGYDPFCRSLSHLPLAQITLDKIIEILNQSFSRTPLIGLYESKKYEILSSLELSRTIFLKNKNEENSGLKFIEASLNHIKTAVDLVGYAPNRSVEIATLMQYGHISYQLAKYCRLNNFKFKDNYMYDLRNSNKYLNKISERSEVLGLQKNIDKIIEYYV